MAASKASRPRLESGAPPEDLERELEALRERLGREGAVRMAGIKPRALKEGLVARLTAEGFELGGAWMRRPLAEQIREALAPGERMTQPVLMGRVRGATAAELARAVTELEAGRALHRVMHGASEVLVAVVEVHDVLGALDATRDARTGLSFVPHLVQRLLSGTPVAAIHAALLAAAREERIELRPEGGLARLTREELGLCPPGPSGTRLSWARRLDAGS